MRNVFLFILLIFISSCTKSQVAINGPGAGSHINGSGTTIPIEVQEYLPSQTGNITFQDHDFWFSAPGLAKTGYTQRTGMSYVEFRTIEREITLRIGGNWANKLTQSYINIQVDGVQNQFVSLTTDEVEEQKTIILPAGEKIVRIINGYNAALSPFNESVVYADASVNVNGIITDTAFEIRIPQRPKDLWLFSGNSITMGASGTNPTVTGFPALFRNDGRSVGNYSWGGRIAATTTTTLADSFAIYVSALMNGTNSNEFFPTLGTNNYGIHNQTKAAFKTTYGLMLDALIQLRPDIVIYCVSLINRTNYDSGNSVGATGDDYADAIEELCLTRPTTRFIYGKNLVTLANCPDGIHPNQTGMNEYHTNLLAAYDLLAKTKVIPMYDYAKWKKIVPVYNYAKWKIKKHFKRA